MDQSKGSRTPNNLNVAKLANSANLHRKTSATSNHASAIYRINLNFRGKVSKSLLLINPL
jgi:hypothetical protein